MKLLDKKSIKEIEIDYDDKKCPECGAWAFIPNLVTDICQECWEEQKFVQYFYMENVGIAAPHVTRSTK